MTDSLPSDQGATNTDREIWRERSGDYYADSIHVTKEGFIGINCGGYVYVKPLREWHRLAGGKEAMQPVPDRPVQTEVCPVCHTVHDKPLCPVHMGLDGETPHQGLRNDCDMCAPETTANVARLHPPTAKLSRLSDIYDELIREMRRQGFETLQGVYDGVRIRIDPWPDSQEKTKARRRFCPPLAEVNCANCLQEWSRHEGDERFCPQSSPDVKAERQCKGGGKCPEPVWCGEDNECLWDRWNKK